MITLQREAIRESIIPMGADPLDAVVILGIFLTYRTRLSGGIF